MPSKNKSKDHAAALAKALDRIDDLEIQVHMLKVQLEGLAVSVGALVNRPDPWRPIGPRPDQPSPFIERPPLPWEIRPGIVPPRPAPGRPYIGDEPK